MARLLYLHGSGHTPESFAHQVEAFEGSRSLALPGHPTGTPMGTVRELAGWLDGEIKAQTTGPAVICGNSLGAAVALETALSYPEQVAGLILIGAGARLRVGIQIFELIDNRWPECVAELVDLSVDPSCSLQIRQRIREMHLVVGQHTTRMDYAACNEFDVMDRLNGLAIPALIVVGSQDRMTPPKYAQYLREHVADSRLLVVEGSGHMPHLERPAAVNMAIAEWIGLVG